MLIWHGPLSLWQACGEQSGYFQSRSKKVIVQGPASDCLCQLLQSRLHTVYEFDSIRTIICPKGVAKKMDPWIG